MIKENDILFRVLAKSKEKEFLDGIQSQISWSILVFVLFWIVGMFIYHAGFQSFQESKFFQVVLFSLGVYLVFLSTTINHYFKCKKKVKRLTEKDILLTNEKILFPEYLFFSLSKKGILFPQDGYYELMLNEIKSFDVYKEHRSENLFHIQFGKKKDWIFLYNTLLSKDLESLKSQLNLVSSYEPGQRSAIGKDALNKLKLNRRRQSIAIIVVAILVYVLIKTLPI